LPRWARRLFALTDAHLDRDADIPVLTGPQSQGDIGVRPVLRRAPTVTPIPAGGVVVAAGREGHEHLLLPGAARFEAVHPPPGSPLIGILTVPAGCEAYLAHDQHGCLGVGPGTYEIGGQREWTPESWQRVAD
jgi:hypothetical protein